MPLKRFGVSLEDNLLESLDQYVSENGSVFWWRRMSLKRNGNVTISWQVRSFLCMTR